MFDNFKVQNRAARDSLVPGIVGVADASISSGALLVQGSTRGGEAVDGWVAHPAAGGLGK